MKVLNVSYVNNVATATSRRAPSTQRLRARSVVPNCARSLQQSVKGGGIRRLRQLLPIKTDRNVTRIRCKDEESNTEEQQESSPGHAPTPPPDEQEPPPKEDIEVKKEEDKKEAPSKEEAYTEALKKMGVTKQNAARILQAWKETGADSPSELRRMFVKGSLQPLSVSLIQLLLDGGACAGAFAFSQTMRVLDPFPFQFGFEILGTFVGFYFLASVVFDVVSLGTLAFAIVQFGTNTDAFLSAVERLAGASDLGVVTKAKAVVDAIKVFQALNNIVDILKEQAEFRGKDTASTLANLSSYLILVRAKEDFGFDPVALGITEDEAGNIAVQFARFDLNDDGVLEASEIRKLCEALGKTFTDEELETAMDILDKDKSGVIEFDEFADWWCKKVQLPESKKE